MSDARPPMRFCIITPSFNQRDYLKQTADSILQQQGNFDLTWWVFDGGSTDGTVDLLSSINDPRLQWISEKDAGQSDAINKGLARAYADGAIDIIGWINSDDVYAPGAFAAVAEAFAADPHRGWLVGQCDIIDAAGQEIRRSVTAYKNRGLRRYNHRRLLRENVISQPAVFWRHALGKHVGLLDPTLHHAMDYDLWLRFAQRSDPIILNRLLARFRIHSTSKTGQLVRDRFKEDMAVAARHASGDRLSYLLHRLNVEKIVWSYRAMRLLGR